MYVYLLVDYFYLFNARISIIMASPVAGYNAPFTFDTIMLKETPTHPLAHNTLNKHG